MEYLIRDKDMLYEVKGDDIKRMVDRADKTLEDEGQKGLQKYETSLLHEFYCMKLRIDIIVGEDNTSPNELTRLKFHMSAVNEALLYIIKINPEGELAKAMSEEDEVEEEVEDKALNHV